MKHDKIKRIDTKILQMYRETFVNILFDNLNKTYRTLIIKLIRTKKKINIKKKDSVSYTFLLIRFVSDCLKKFGRSVKSIEGEVDPQISLNSQEQT